MSLMALVLLPSIWIVDAANGPGAHYRTLQDAVDVARKGDTILVRSGTDPTCTIVGKALTIRGDGSGTTTIEGLAVLGVPAMQFVTLAGLRFEAAPGSGQPGLLLVGPGTVVVSDCQALGADGDMGTAGVHLSAGLQLHATRSSFLGGDGTYTGLYTSLGGRAAELVNLASLTASQCAFLGGVAQDNPTGSTHGGEGVLVFASEALLFDSTCFGGAAGAASMAGTAIGGDAVYVQGGKVRVVGGQLPVLQGGGAAGFGSTSNATAGNAVHRAIGDAIVHDGVQLLPAAPGAPVTFGTVVLNQPEVPRLSVAASYLPSGETDALQPLTATYDGLVPDAAWFLIVGFRPAVSSAVVPDLRIDLAAAGAMVGVLDGNGRFTVSFVPAWLLGLDGVPFFAQAGTLDPALGPRTSNCDVRLYGH